MVVVIGAFIRIFRDGAFVFWLFAFPRGLGFDRGWGAFGRSLRAAGARKLRRGAAPRAGEAMPRPRLGFERVQAE